jgi:hypothetical protein
MCLDAETFLKHAKAEKELCDEAGAVLTRIISEIQDHHGISVVELRVTMDWSHSANGWPAANCVMVREEGVPAGNIREKTRVAATGVNVR